VRYYIYTPGGFLLCSIDAATHAIQYYHADRNGNVLALTGSSGSVTDSYAYGPYGEPLATTGNSPQPFRWLGAWGVRTDAVSVSGSDQTASTLYHIGARWFDPATGRFLSRDPSGARLDEVRTLDPYLYAFGDPATYIDVTGARPNDPSQVLIETRIVGVNRDFGRRIGVDLLQGLDQRNLIRLGSASPAAGQLGALGVSVAPAAPCDPCCDPCDPCCYGPPLGGDVVRLGVYVRGLSGINPFGAAAVDGPGFVSGLAAVQPQTSFPGLGYDPISIYGSNAASFLQKPLNIAWISNLAGTNVRPGITIDVQPSVSPEGGVRLETIPGAPALQDVPAGQVFRPRINLDADYYRFRAQITSRTLGF
jgi:RHS repeat-associated protein